MALSQLWLRRVQLAGGACCQDRRERETTRLPARFANGASCVMLCCCLLAPAAARAWRLTPRALRLCGIATLCRQAKRSLRPRQASSAWPAAGPDWMLLLLRPPPPLLLLLQRLVRAGACRKTVPCCPTASNAPRCMLISPAGQAAKRQKTDKAKKQQPAFDPSQVHLRCCMAAVLLTALQLRMFHGWRYRSAASCCTMRKPPAATFHAALPRRSPPSAAVFAAVAAAVGREGGDSGGAD